MIYEEIKIWDNQDFYVPTAPEYEPILTVYSLSNSSEVDLNKKRPAILIAPGGGYNMVSERESESVMAQFLAKGYVCAILKYSVRNVSSAVYPSQLLEISRAMWLLRLNSEKYQVDVDKIAVIGFSAGGHLAGNLAVAWNRPFISEKLGMPAGMNKPNAAILAYAVLSSQTFSHKGSFDSLIGENASEEQILDVSCDLLVGAHTPPTFLWHTANDNVVPVENTLLFASALSKHEIPFEVHIYPQGSHGLSIATNEVGSPNEHVSNWVSACLSWTELVLDNKQF